MKLIIFEGTDRVGKNTQIHKCAEMFNNVAIKHWIGPPKNLTSVNAMIDHQKLIFTEEFMFWWNQKNSINNRFEAIIWNRSHIGEHVYGQLYRGYDPNWIFGLEDTFRIGEEDEAYLINFWGDGEFIMQWEDGKSSSKCISDKEDEMILFKDAVEMSRINNKLNIKVNHGNIWRSRQEIATEINNFIFSK